MSDSTNEFFEQEMQKEDEAFERVERYLITQCPHCRQFYTPAKLRQHDCGSLFRKIDKQDWIVAVDKARVAAGLPEMIYGYEVHFYRRDGSSGKFRFSGSEKAARRKAVYQTNFAGVEVAIPYTYQEYCRAFGVPGSKTLL